MDENLNTILVLGNAFAMLAFVGFALFIFWQQRLSGVTRQIPHRVLIATALLSAAWTGTVLLYGLTGRNEFFTASRLADVLRYYGWYVFIASILLMRKKSIGASSQSALLLVGIASVVCLTGLPLHLMYPVDIEADWLITKPVQIHSLAMPVVTLFFLEQLLRNLDEDSRWNLKPMALGLTAVCFFDLYLHAQTLMFGRIDPEILSVRGLINALVIPLYASSIARSRDWARRIKVSNKIVIHTTMLLVVGAYLLIMAGMGYLVRFLGGDWGLAFQTTMLFAALAALLVLIFSSSVRARIRLWVVKNFFHYRYDYREEWLKFTQAISAQNTPEGLADQIIRELADMVESPAGCLWVREVASGNVYKQFATWNMPVSKALEQENSPFCRFLRERKWVINLDEFERDPGIYGDLILPEWLVGLKQPWLIAPLTVGNELIGFLVLAHARTRLDANWEVVDLLKTAGSQAAGHLAQLLAMEALLEAKKFDAFNRMSAFVVHDLKNLIAQLGLMLKNAEKHHDNPEFQKDMLETVAHSVDRMRRMMAQLQEGGSSAKVSRGVDLQALFKHLHQEKQKVGKTLNLTLQPDLQVRGDQERLTRVFGHLVQNAIDASAHTVEPVEISTRRESNMAHVEIRDAGCGMTEDFIRERLFKPFQTTKSVGMGIGAYESYQYFRELGGDITAQSQVNAGTTITVTLPLFQATGAA